MVNFEKLSSVCSIQNGYAFKSSDYREDGIPLLRISNFDNGDVFLNDKQIFLKEEFLKSKKDFIVNKGDVLIALSGATTGKYGVYNFNYPSLLNQRIGLIKSSNSDKLDNRYFMHYLNVMQKEILRNAAGAAQPNISTNKIGNFKIPLPPLETQKRIAEILDNAAALKEKTEQLLTEYDALAQSIFLDMFGDPVMNPKGWEVNRLEDLGKTITGGTPSRKFPEYFKGNIPWVTTVSLGKRYIDETDAVEFITKDAIYNSSTKIIPKGSIMIGVRVGVGKASILNVDMCSNQDILSIVNVASCINKEFLTDVLSFYQNYFNSQKRGATIQGIKSRTIRELDIICPPIELQNEFAEKIALIEKQKELAKQELKESEDLFNALLQKAFKGELV